MITVDWPTSANPHVLEERTVTPGVLTVPAGVLTDEQLEDLKNRWLVATAGGLRTVVLESVKESTFAFKRRGARP